MTFLEYAVETIYSIGSRSLIFLVISLSQYAMLEAV